MGLLAREADVNPLDCWGGTSLNDAHRENRQAVAELILPAASVELAPALVAP